MEKTAQTEYWNLSPEQVLLAYKTRDNGLTNEEVLDRHHKYGLNLLQAKKVKAWSILVRQVKGNALVILLSVATTISFLLGERVSALYIFLMILMSIVMGFWNEFFAEKTIETLLKRVSLNAMIMRNREKTEVPTSQVTIGDVVLLAPGSIAPADLRLIEANHLEINESALTGESKTVGKTIEKLTMKRLVVTEAKNMVFMGTVVANGWGRGIVVKIGKETEFGKISESISFLKPETTFQQGLTQFGNMLIKVILILTAVMFGVNVLLRHPLLDSVLFALAIAVGLTPELLPVIVTVSLSHGARKLLKKEVLVKQLVAIENLGNMDVLCTDKTGTLTEGRMRLTSIMDFQGKEQPELLKYGLWCNSAVVHHRIVGDAIDSALWEHAIEKKVVLPKHITKIYEEPFDFDRKAMFSVINDEGQREIIVKGAPEVVVGMANNAHQHQSLLSEFQDLSNAGQRVIALGKKKVEVKAKYSFKDAEGLEFVGYCTFLDTPKKTAKAALERLKKLNVMVKVITGDNELITKRVCKEVGFTETDIVTGEQLTDMNDEELEKCVMDVEVFARVAPEQKLRIVKMLQKMGHTVGFMGDGINDAPSLYSADVGISVNDAVDVAKNSASVVLMKKSLQVIAEGIIEGRSIFNNTIKYILMGTSSNFGNMFSAAGASFFLPFLPMRPLQILVNNGLYDLSQMTIPSDNVDPESLLKPRHWNIGYIKRYMIFFGPISSLYDFLTFGMMYFVFNARNSLFQTGWFIESLATQVLVVFVIRTGRTPFFKSRPGKYLTLTCLGVVGTGVLLTTTRFGDSLGFTPLPMKYFVMLAMLTGTYLALVEVSKKVFLRKFNQ